MLARLRHGKGLWSLLLIVGLVSGGATWLREREQQVWVQAMRAKAGPGDLRLLSSRTCIYCDRARDWLTRHAIPFEECFVEQDAVCLQRYQATGARGTPTVQVREQVLLGFDPQRVAQALGGRL
jgi:glutaredoxin